jgi:hypothetical protein
MQYPRASNLDEFYWRGPDVIGRLDEGDLVEEAIIAGNRLLIRPSWSPVTRLGRKPTPKLLVPRPLIPSTLSNSKYGALMRSHLAGSCPITEVGRVLDRISVWKSASVKLERIASGRGPRLAASRATYRVSNVQPRTGQRASRGAGLQGEAF